MKPKGAAVVPGRPAQRHCDGPARRHHPQDCRSGRLYQGPERQGDLIFAPRSPPVRARPSWPWRTGVSLLLLRKVDKLVITRPAVEAGERLGFLPGDLNEKIDPYLTPILGGTRRYSRRAGPGQEARGQGD
ncbi:MAG: PhoH family protein [Asticcacaulis sp.]